MEGKDVDKHLVRESPDEEATSKKRQPCPDTEGLGCWGGNGVYIGYVSEVNGPDSVEMPEFVPTRYELLQLAKYWATLALDLQFDFFLYAQTGSSEYRLDAFARRRVGRIAEILGREQVDKLIDQVYAPSRSSSGAAALRFSAKLEESWDRDAVQISLDRAAIECVRVRRRAEHYPLGIDPPRSRQTGNFVF
jgi:hypothetical protein